MFLVVPHCRQTAAAQPIIQALEIEPLDIRLIAEGVETEEQRSTMQALGCTSAQGNLFGRPVEWAKALPARANVVR